MRKVLLDSPNILFLRIIIDLFEVLQRTETMIGKVKSRTAHQFDAC